MQSQAWRYVRQRRGQRRSPLQFLHVQPRRPGVGKSSSMASRTRTDPQSAYEHVFVNAATHLFRGTQSSTGLGPFLTVRSSSGSKIKRNQENMI